MISSKNQVDYSQYECPYSHIEKECGHELHGPEGYENTYGVWCACGFRGPVFCLDPKDLMLRKKDADGWYCERFYQIVSGVEVTYSEHHDNCGGRCS